MIIGAFDDYEKAFWKHILDTYKTFGFFTTDIYSINLLKLTGHVMHQQV